jgi:hypothetical protein
MNVNLGKDQRQLRESQDQMTIFKTKNELIDK